MSSSKKRKIADVGRAFQNEWTDTFFFIEEKKAVLFKVQKIAISHEERKFKTPL